MAMASEILQNLRNRDHYLSVITNDGHFRVVLLKANDLVREAIERHALNPLAGIILGELLMGTALMASGLKGQQRVSLRIDCNGPMKQAMAEASANGEVRGYLAHTDLPVNFPTRKEMVANAIGIGLLHVTRLLHHDALPITGSTDLPYSDIAKDITYFCAVSDQSPTAMQLSLDFSKTGTLDYAVGLMVSVLPNAPEEKVLEMENMIASISNLGSLFFEAGSLEETMAKILEKTSYKPLERTKVDFFCSCSKERFKRGLSLLELDELKQMAAEKEQSLQCHWCSEVYNVSGQEIAEIINNITTKKK